MAKGYRKKCTQTKLVWLLTVSFADKSGVNVMVTFFRRFLPFFDEKMAFFFETNVMIIFFGLNISIFNQNRQ
jgi:hypothetical protein